MLLPDRLLALIDDGIITQVLRSLKSGKEASLYVVEAEDGICAAKVYKEADKRSFRNRQDYVEGRMVGDTRQQRAMDKGSRFGRTQRESVWHHAEGDALERLGQAGVRVPRLRQRCDGVLLMDLVCDAHGEPAPQLATLRFTRDEARQAHHQLVHQIAKMLCAGLVHADLSEYNILLAGDGPMIIDLPQAVDAARNTSAKKLLLRDVANLTRFFCRFAPELKRSEYGQEMWLLYEQSVLKPDTQLTGRYEAARGIADAEIVLREIASAKAEAAKRAEVAQWREEKRLARLALNQQPLAGAPKPAAPAATATTTTPAPHPPAAASRPGDPRPPPADHRRPVQEPRTQDRRPHDVRPPDRRPHDPRQQDSRHTDARPAEPRQAQRHPVAPRHPVGPRPGSDGRSDRAPEHRPSAIPRPAHPPRIQAPARPQAPAGTDEQRGDQRERQPVERKPFVRQFGRQPPDPRRNAGGEHR